MTEHDVSSRAKVPLTWCARSSRQRSALLSDPARTQNRCRRSPPGLRKVFFHDEHPFEDDAGFPASRYRYWVSVEDSARDEERQLAVARQVVDAVKAEGWSAMLSYGLQGSLVMYP